jgi:polygalacturonase
LSLRGKAQLFDFKRVNRSIYAEQHQDFGVCRYGISDDRAAIQRAIDKTVAYNKGGVMGVGPVA